MTLYLREMMAALAKVDAAGRRWTSVPPRVRRALADIEAARQLGDWLAVQAALAAFVEEATR